MEHPEIAMTIRTGYPEIDYINHERSQNDEYGKLKDPLQQQRINEVPMSIHLFLIIHKDLYKKQGRNNI